MMIRNILLKTRLWYNFRTGFGNYTEERRALVEHQTLDEVLTDLRRYQAKRTPREQDLPSQRLHETATE